MVNEVNNLIRLHTIIEGRVQGVGFRYFVQEKALTLGLNGWVRNRWEGSVEVVAEGNKQTLDQFLRDLHRGPRSANVTQVIPKWETANGEFSHFNIRLTA